MNKLYCDFCGEEIIKHWDTIKHYKLDLLIDGCTTRTWSYDICVECVPALQNLVLNKSFKEEVHLKSFRKLMEIRLTSEEIAEIEREARREAKELKK